MAMSNQYTLYHLHSDLSNGVTNIDSVTKYGEYIERAKECGMKAMVLLFLLWSDCCEIHNSES